MSRISEALASAHGKAADLPYWETVLGAWLGTAMSVLKDRLEILKTMVNASPHPPAILDTRASSILPPKNTEEFVKLASSSDSWNRQLLVHLSREHFKNELHIVEGELEHNHLERRESHSQASLHSPLPFLLNLAKRFLENLLGFASNACNTKTPRQPIAVDSSYLSLLYLIRLKWRMKSNATLVRVKKPTRESLSGNFSARKDFREYLSSKPATGNQLADLFLREVPYLLPKSFLEHFDRLRSEMISLNAIPKIVLTANSHWYDDSFKIWAAEMRACGSKLVFSEHGGSFEALEYLFDFEQRAADIFISGWPPRRSNEKLLPLRLDARKVNRKLSKFRRNLVLITYPGDKWAIRASSQPQSYRAVSVAQDLDSLVSALRVVPKPNVLVQLKKSGFSWKLLESRYASGNLSSCRVVRETLPRVLKQARLVVCTYPQTTFTDSLIEGVPTILMFNPDVSGVSEDAMSVIRILRDQNIVFFSPVEAAKFIDSVWDNPFDWWNLPGTQAAVGEFMRFSGLDSDSPLIQWSLFLTDLAKGQAETKG
jgi:putative transferase (TIGR04331 family)